VLFYNCGSLYWDGAYGNEYTDCMVSGAAYGYIPQNGIKTNLRNKIIDCQRGLLCGYNNSVDYNIYNMQFINCTYDVSFSPTNKNNRKTNLIDCLIDTNKFTLGTISEGNKCTLNLKSTFTFIIENGDGAEARLFDKDGSLYDTIEISGETKKEITYYSVYVEGPSTKIDTVSSPFRLEISKDGYENLIINEIEITSGIPTFIRGKLIEETPPIYYQDNLIGETKEQELIAELSAENLKGKVNNDIVSGKII
jgi:hypothetical protein